MDVEFDLVEPRVDVLMVKPVKSRKMVEGPVVADARAVREDSPGAGVWVGRLHDVDLMFGRRVDRAQSDGRHLKVLRRESERWLGGEGGKRQRDDWRQLKNANGM